MIVTLDELKSFCGIDVDVTSHDDLLEMARLAGEGDTRRITGRSFERQAATSDRVFVPASTVDCWIDDVYDLTGFVLATDEDDDGTYETTWAAGDYELHPLNGRLQGQSWPYHRVHAVESRWFPVGVGRLGTVRVTARWGWSEIPEAVRLATCVFAASRERIRELVRGEGGFTRWSREDAAEMLRPFVHPSHGIAVA